MKRLFIILAAAMMAVGAMGQDVIYRSENDSIQAKIITVNKSEITYRLAGYADGPLFTIDTDGIMAVRYANGVYQTFARTANPQSNSQKIVQSTTQSKKSALFIGGTAAIGYTGLFNIALEPIIGYEFNDRIAIGTGAGMVAAIYAQNSYSLKLPRRAKSSSSYNYVMGIVEPFVRVCAWHNDVVFIDFKATAGIGFTDKLELCQVGVRPSLRVRLTEHCEMAADIGLFGAQYTSDQGWTPAIGISATSVGLWFAYRF